MRLAINLASQPYEVAREYKHRMTMLIGGLALLAVLLVGYIVYQRANSRAINRQLAQEQGQINALENEEAQAHAILNKPANKAIAQQSDFLNDLFARKSLSWTRIFMQMEKIMPADLHVVSMKPEYTKNNDLVLHVIVATDSRDRAVELVRHMEQSSHFRQPQVVAESVLGNSSGQNATGAIQFDIAAIYVPSSPDADEADDQPPAATVNKAAKTPVSPATPSNVKAAQNRPVPMRTH